MSRPSLTAVSRLTIEVNEQRQWVASKGGDLAGYIATYASPDDPDRGEAYATKIWEADSAELARLETLLAAALHEQYTLTRTVDGDLATAVGRAIASSLVAGEPFAVIVFNGSSEMHVAARRHCEDGSMGRGFSRLTPFYTATMNRDGALSVVNFTN